MYWLVQSQCKNYRNDVSCNIPAGFYVLKVDDENTRTMCEMCETWTESQIKYYNIIFIKIIFLKKKQSMEIYTKSD